MARIRILLASRSDAVADAICAKFESQPDIRITKKVVTNGHSDPLHDVKSLPDILLLHYVPGYGELDHLGEQHNEPIPLIVFGPADDHDAMRRAMRAGASDYLPQPLHEEDLLASIRRVAQTLARNRAQAGRLVTVVNSKGGSGASFVAANLACLLAAEKPERSLLIDLDLQFGSLSKYFDLEPERGLLEALDAVEEIDDVSAETYITKHSQGLRLLAAPSERLVLTRDIASERVESLLQVFLASNDFVVVDLPRRINNLSASILEQTDEIIIVTQQSLVHVNEAARMMQMVTKELAVAPDRITVVVNRHSKKSIIETDDIRKTLRMNRIQVIPNNYKQVAESIDTGMPVVYQSKNSAVSRGLAELKQAVLGDASDDRTQGRGFFSRALPGIIGRS